MVGENSFLVERITVPFGWLAMFDRATRPDACADQGFVAMRKEGAGKYHASPVTKIIYEGQYSNQKRAG